ncbi:type IV secretion system protein (plasmid) [Methylocaldum gracile subsp. desertum]|uniref:type IV secretion system protein n=1 Tax=Methylocaldum sp. GT1BW TaxID=3438964 RepID=UPI003DA0DA2F
MMQNTRFFITALLAVISVPSFAADQGADYGSVIDRFEWISNQFTAAIDSAAHRLFYLLAALDVGLLGRRLLKSPEPETLGATVVIRVFFYFFIWAVMINDWLLDVVQGFMQLGMQGAHLNSFKVGDLLREGLNLIATMINMFNGGAGGSLAVLTNPFAAFTLGLCVIMVLISFLVLVAQYLVIMLQMYVYVAFAPLLLAFGGLVFTKDIALRTMSASVVIGVRMMMIFFVIAVARELVPLMGVDIGKSGLDNLSPLLSAVGMAFLLAFLAMKGPALASDLIGGSASLSAGDALIPGASAAAGAIAGAVAGGVVSGFKEIVARMPDGPMKSALDSTAALQAATDLAQHASMSPGLPMNGFSSDGGSDTSGSNGKAPDLRPSWLTEPNPMAATDFADAKLSQDSNDGGQSGSIGEAGPDQSDTSRFGASVAEHVRGGLQEFAQAEKAQGASVNIHGGHDD